MNKLVLVGRLVKDLELRYTAGIGNNIASEIKCNKSCSNKKDESDVGGDAMDLLVNGYKG